MLKKNRSAPNTAVIPVLYYPDVPEAVEWLTTVLPLTERLRNSDNRRQLVHGNGAIVVIKPGAHADAVPSILQSPAAHSITLRLTGIDLIFERAKAAGARVLAEHGPLLLLGTNYFLHQRLETRIAAERIEHRIDFNQGDG